MTAPVPTKLDLPQVLNRVFDEDKGQLRVAAEATIVNADIDVSLDSTEDSVAIKSSTGIEMDINPDGSVTVVEGLRTGGVYGALSMPSAGTAYEAKVGVSALANRRSLQITATTAGIYWGTDASVTVATGSPLMNNQSISFDSDPNSTFRVFLVSATINRTARIVEIP
jgi:hypothetical protein